ncbi:DUF1775 domain-containing protein [Streptomyces sp. NPDC051180]|uniref:DUF1775 domain-containing protein n=1 Tax=Streptomyces sp. NPDC051180 TaxID=3155797 RepID=UPI00345093FB
MFRATPARLYLRAPLVVSAALAVSLATAGSGVAHVEVEAKGATALAENVEVSFTAETESAAAGITRLEVILPAGIGPGDVVYKSGPAGWELTRTARGYAVSGPAVAVGKDAAYAVVVRQLPEARSLAFKTLQTYGDGRVDRWIELEKAGAGHGNSAPVLEVGPAAPGARPLASATTPPAATTPVPSASVTSAPAAQGADAKDEPGNAGEEIRRKEAESSSAVAKVIVGAVLLALVLAGAVLWFRRRGGEES